jgi:hypothetical protein
VSSFLILLRIRNVGKAARELGRHAILCDINAIFDARRLRLTAAAFAPPQK